MTRIAFYAPIKPPDHPIASGDRLIAQNLMAALTLGGHEAVLASRFIAYSKREAKEILVRKKAEALEEAARIVKRYASHPPDLWLTYHPYCKAPDWIGPSVSRALNTPYVTVEAAQTGQGLEGGQDRWATWRAEAQVGIRQADRHLAFKPTDKAYLTTLLGSDEKIRMIPPFIDTSITAPKKAFSPPTYWRKNAPTLIAVGMMRPGKKLKNYQLLAEALTPLSGLHWNLIIAGDGPEEQAVRKAFSHFDANRLFFAGALSHDDVLAAMSCSDVFVWPGLKEPIGMVYLEAQWMGLPVAALDSMGVSLSVAHGKTGLLADEENADAFSQTLATILSHPILREDLALNAREHILAHHSMQKAADCLDQNIQDILLNFHSA